MTAAKDVLQTMDGWLGHADPLREWTNAVLQQHTARLSLDMNIGVEQLEVYAPEVFESQRKVGRWIRAVQIGHALEGLRLCRLRHGAGTFGAPHFLATFHYKGGTLTIGRSAPLAAETSRRLRFGFDLLVQTPRQVAISIDGSQLSFSNSISLPETEARVLSLAWRNLRGSTDNSESYYFHALALPLILRAFARLQIVPTIIDRRPHA